MSQWRWLVMGVSALTSWGWGHGNSQAGESHILQFTPPTMPPDGLELSSAIPSVRSSPSPPPGVSPLPVPDTPLPESDTSATVPAPPLPDAISALFASGVESIVAHAVGYAEGTRTPDGHRTLAYYGHVDPGNQQWNQGTFSYQQEASSPQEADQKQLAHLKRQAQVLYGLAASAGIVLTPLELLNGIDLANQAPRAALDRGYIHWLAAAKELHLPATEAIVWARTRAFLDPDTGRWNAPGLGNSIQSITRDQARRQQAIAEVLKLKAQATSLAPSQPLATGTLPTPGPRTPPTEAVDIMLSMDLPLP